MNVKTSLRGCRLNKAHQNPLINNPRDKNMSFLNHFLEWLDDREAMATSAGKLTRETHSAIKHTTYGIIEL